jgi:hypothetical protein
MKFLLLKVTDRDPNIFSCEMIEYFASEPYYPDPGDSSLAIPCEYIILNGLSYH